jgi:hypothetical protein
MFFFGVPVRNTVFTEIMLRSKIGMFVGSDGTRFHRCIISNVDRERDRLWVYGAWLGIAAPHDLNNFTTKFKIDKNCSGALVEADELEKFTTSIGRHRYTMYLPYDIKRHDEIIFQLR